MCKLHKDLREKYDHALDSMWYLFSEGRKRERLLEDELQRIKVICTQIRGDRQITTASIAEIEGICDRGLSS